MNYQLMRRLLLVSALIGCSACKPKGGATDSDELLKGPATVAQALRVIDLSTFPLMDGAAPNPNRSVASLTYTVARTNVKSAFEFQRKNLKARGWKESAHDTSVTEQSASSTFKRNGFVLSVAAYPVGNDGGITVSLNNHGNVDYSTLPRPGETKPLYVGDSTAMYLTSAPVPGTTEECGKLLTAEGWQPYGTAGDTHSFKQNAILLHLTVSSAPAQGGKTVISYASELMSADLPAPAEAEDLRYSDMTRELSFETAAGKEEVVDFYKRTLAPAHWESTLEKTVDIDEKPTMILRNPAKDMLTLTFSSGRNGKIPVSLQHQSAAELAELERRMKEKEPELRAELKRREAKAEAEFAEAHKALPKINVTLPGDASEVERSASEIKFNVAKGKAKLIADGWRKEFHNSGWKEEVAVAEAMAGSISFSKERASLTIHYTDTGFMPAEVTISSIGAELETAPK